MSVHNSRRNFLKKVGLTSIGLSLTSFYCNKNNTKRPNILFCITDDQSYPHASAYGCKFVKTPAFDRVAKEGILFHNAFVSTPSCCPSRGSILSGQDFYRLKEASMNHTIWPGNIPLYTDILAQAGYHVGYTGKGWGPGNLKISGRKINPSGPSYNDFTLEPVGEKLSKSHYAKNFEEFLNKRKQNQPFCFWFGASEPHREFEEGIGIRLGKRLEDVDVPGFFLDSGDVRSDILDYAVEIEWADKQLGRMLKILEKIDEIDNTIIVVTSDNGMAFPRAKATLYDYGSRMPLAIRWGEKIKSGCVVEDFVSFRDFAPTFLDAAGILVPKQMTGKSLMNIFLSEDSDQSESYRDFVVFGVERHFPGSRPNGAGYPIRAIRTYNYLYIKNYTSEQSPAGDHPGPVWPANDPVGGFGDTDGGPTKTYMWNNRDNYPELVQLAFGKRPSEELYDVKNDPFNMKNLCDDPIYQSIKMELSIELQNYLEQTEDPRATGNEKLFDDIMKKYPVIGSNR